MTTTAEYFNFMFKCIEREVGDLVDLDKTKEMMPIDCGELVEVNGEYVPAGEA